MFSFFYSWFIILNAHFCLDLHVDFGLFLILMLRSCLPPSVFLRSVLPHGLHLPAFSMLPHLSRVCHQSHLPAIMLITGLYLHASHSFVCSWDSVMFYYCGSYYFPVVRCLYYWSISSDWISQSLWLHTTCYSKV